MLACRRALWSLRIDARELARDLPDFSLFPPFSFAKSPSAVSTICSIIVPFPPPPSSAPLLLLFFDSSSTSSLLRLCWLSLVFITGWPSSSSSSSSSSTLYVSIKSAKSSERMIWEMIIHEIMNSAAAFPEPSIVQCMTSNPSSPDAVTKSVSIARMNDLKLRRPASSSSWNTHPSPKSRVPRSA